MLIQGYKFPKKRRIKCNSDFKRIMAGRQCISANELLIFNAKNDLGYSRAGFSVGKRFGNAALRNRLKRLLRESFRLCEQVPDGYDFIIMFNSKLAVALKNGKLKLSYEQVAYSMDYGMSKLADRGAKSS